MKDSAITNSRDRGSSFEDSLGGCDPFCIILEKSPLSKNDGAKTVEPQANMLLEGQNFEVPLPAAYTRQVSYGYTNDQPHDSDVYTEVKESVVQSPESEVSTLKDDEQEISTGKRQKSVLIFLRSSRFYIRVLAILVMIASFSLILTAVIMFSKAQKKPGNPLSSVPQPAPITDQVSKALCSCTLTTLSYCSESMSHSYSHSFVNVRY